MLNCTRVSALLGMLLLFGVAAHAQSGRNVALEPETPGTQGPVSSSASAARLVKFSGTLRDGSGAPLTGTIGVTVSIYKDQQGGTALWMETQNVSLDAQGNYTVLLGATQSEGLPLELFSTGESRWLGVQAQLPGELEQPRVLLVSVPYALKAADAETLGGQPASAFLLNPEAITDQMLKTSASNGGTKAAVGTGPMAAISGSGTTNEVPKWTDGPNGILGDSSISESGGNVGVGTPATGERLTVNGPSNLAGDIDMTRRFDNFSQAFFAIDNVITTSMNFAKLGGGNVSNIGFFGNSIYAAGNLGVGTPATGERLTVNGPSNLAGDIDMTRRFDNFSQAFFSIDNVITTSMNFGKLGGGNVDNIGFFGNLIYIPGNVGIGTPSPSQMLDVNGNAHIGGNLSLTGTFNASAGTTFSGASASTFTAAPSGSGVNQGSLYVDPASAGAGQTLIGAAVNGTQEFKVDSGGSITTNGNINLPNTNGAGTTGVITLGGNRFLHNFGTDNTFVGQNAGNFTLSSFANTAIGFHALFSDTSGFSNTASGADALESNTTGNYNTADGQAALSSNTSGFSNTAVGVEAGQSQTPGNANTTGANNTFIGFRSGPGTSTQLSNATAIGANAVVSSNNSLVLGSISGVNGASSSVNVGIGTASPGAALQVSGAEATLNGKTAAVEVSNTASGGANWYLRAGATGNNTPAGGFSIADDNGYRLLIDNTGNVGIGTNTPGKALDVVGDIRASGCVSYNGGSVGSCSSDVRLKKNIQYFPRVLDKLVQLQPASWNWRTEEFPEYHFGPGRNVGLVAQEVEKIFPDMVSTDERGYKQVNYSELPYLMLQAIRELKAENDTLREQIRKLEARTDRENSDEVGQLRREVEQLRALVVPLMASSVAVK